MRIAVASQGSEMTSRVDPRFARAPYFVIYDTETGSVETLDNTKNMQAAHGAGTQAAQDMSAKQVDVVVSGQLGPKAMATLSAAGIETITWSEGTVEAAIEMAKGRQRQ